MFVLGIESSCDETAAAVLDGTGRICSSVVYSQVQTHARFGGIVPEVASREHLEKIGEVTRAALDQAAIGWTELGGIAVTRGPGLIGALLVGVSFAKAAALAHRLPLVGINHLEGHLLAPFLGSVPPYPFLALLVSGGHTSLYLARGLGQYRLLGATRDDAAGEAFDKVAKLLNLGYPGGARIDGLAREGNPQAIRFPRGMRSSGGYDFSFSGLKTAVLYHLKGEAPAGVADVAASFQAAVVDVLVHKTLAAARAQRIGCVVVSGGVAANSQLRMQLEAQCTAAGLALHIPPMRLCTDNAAMIAFAGLLRLQAGQRDGLDFPVVARLPLEHEWVPAPPSLERRVPLRAEGG